MTKEQFIKILKVAIVATFVMLLCDTIFAVDEVNNFFAKLIYEANGIVVYFVIWLVMFLSTTIINVPAYTILAASASVGINVWSIEFIVTIMLAYIVGVIIDYWLGYWFGSKAVKWCAGSQEEFDKWSAVLNQKGKWWYLLSVILPIFPDDLLCIVAGGVKFNFWFFVFSNIIGRLIGLFGMLGIITLVGHIGGNFPIMIVVWSVALIAEIVAYFMLKKNKKVCKK